MKLEATVLAVKNLEVSKQFYMQLFDQKIILDQYSTPDDAVVPITKYLS